MALSPYRQLGEAFVRRQTMAERSLPVPWLDLGGARRERCEADVVLDVDTAKLAKNKQTFLWPPAWVGGTAERMPFADARFGLVTAVDVFYLVADLEAALAEVVRVLRPGGRLVAICPFAYPSVEAGDWRRPTAHAWRWMLRHAGFSAFRVAPLGGPWSLMLQAIHAITQGEYNADMADHVPGMSRGALAISGRKTNELRVHAMPGPERIAAGGAEGQESGDARALAEKALGQRPARGILTTPHHARRVLRPDPLPWYHPAVQRASWAVLAATARTAPLARWLDRRCGVTWPLAHGLVAVR